MTVTPIAAPGASNPAAAAARAPKQTMDGEMFLNLLVTQLKYQDPSSPMDTSAMMQQTTSLASMEQLTALTKTNSESFALQMRATAAALIDKTVSYTDSSGATQSGKVSSVAFKGGVPQLTVGTDTVPLDSLTSVND